MIVDRAHRDQLIASIERYLNDELGAFDFDEEIEQIAVASNDPTISTVRNQLWYFYDDLSDHHVVLNKAGWDYHQRLLLLLKSDAHLIVIRRKEWSATQFVAAMFLAAFGMSASFVGFGFQLLLLTAPLGLASVGLSLFRRPQEKELPAEAAVVPFASIRQIASVRRSVSEFTKRNYPSELSGRRIRRPAFEIGGVFSKYLMWCLFSPAVLLIQTLPATKTTMSVEFLGH